MAAESDGAGMQLTEEEAQEELEIQQNLQQLVSDLNISQEDMEVTPDDIAAVEFSTLGMSMEGAMLKRCRRNGDQRPWKRRWFMLCQGSLLYIHTEEAKGTEAPSLLVHLAAHTAVAPTEAPNGYGILVTSGSSSIAVSCATEKLRDEWMAKLKAAIGLPACELPKGALPGTDLTPASSVRFKMALASMVATSRVGKAIIKRYLEDSAAEFIRAVVEFAHRDAGASLAHRLETNVFDIASRIAVIAMQSRLPQDLDLPTLYDNTIAFCQEFLQYSRDQRLKAERAQWGGTPEPINTDSLLRSAEYVCKTWREIVKPTMPGKSLKRFDEIVDYYFNAERLRKILLDEKYRDLLNTIDRCLRDMMERY